MQPMCTTGRVIWVTKRPGGRREVWLRHSEPRANGAKNPGGGIHHLKGLLYLG